MANSRFLLRANVFSRLLQRTMASEVAASPVPLLAHYSPIELERAETATGIMQKAKKPWGELSNEDKIAIYRASFPYTVEQMCYEESDTKFVIGGVSALLALSVALFTFFKTFVSAEAPRSLNKEWQEVSIEKIKKNRGNPITGLSSE